MQSSSPEGEGDDAHGLGIERYSVSRAGLLGLDIRLRIRRLYAAFLEDMLQVESERVENETFHVLDLLPRIPVLGSCDMPSSP